MERKVFVKHAIAIGGIMAVQPLISLQSLWGGANSARTPVWFIGHGDPMNALRDNAFTQALRKHGQTLENPPQAILVISAHWLTQGSWVCSHPTPETIYDFSGFPQELYQIKYPAPGAPAVAQEVKKLVPEVTETTEWGLDHGAWTVLKFLFPEANIPVLQLSIDYHKPMQYHMELAQKLRSLRDKGVLILGSGNIVHNLRAYFTNLTAVDIEMASNFDNWVNNQLLDGNWNALAAYTSQGKMANFAVPTPDHYIPMLYTIGMAYPGEPITTIYHEMIRSISMRCFQIGG